MRTVRTPRRALLGERDEAGSSRGLERHALVACGSGRRQPLPLRRRRRATVVRPPRSRGGGTSDGEPDAGRRGLGPGHRDLLCGERWVTNRRVLRHARPSRGAARARARPRSGARSGGAWPSGDDSDGGGTQHVVRFGEPVRSKIHTVASLTERRRERGPQVGEPRGGPSWPRSVSGTRRVCRRARVRPCDHRPSPACRARRITDLVESLLRRSRRRERRTTSSDDAHRPSLQAGIPGVSRRSPLVFGRGVVGRASGRCKASRSTRSRRSGTARGLRLAVTRERLFGGGTGGTGVDGAG